jgi:hypothetical protein
MAHLLAPQAALAELPVFFNVDGVVGAPPADNRTEDVLFVQFAFQVIAATPGVIPQADLDVMRAVPMTGTINPQTIAAITLLQTKARASINPAVVVDGRVSPARGRYSYGPGTSWTITLINNMVQDRSLDVWPRIDKIPGFPGGLQNLVQRTVQGV